MLQAKQFKKRCEFCVKVSSHQSLEIRIIITSIIALVFRNDYNYRNAQLILKSWSLGSIVLINVQSIIFFIYVFSRVCLCSVLSLERTHFCGGFRHNEYLKGFSFVLHPCCAYFLIFFLIFLQNKERLILSEEKEKSSEACSELALVNNIILVF